MSLPALLAAAAAAAALATGAPGPAASHIPAAGAPPPHVIDLHRAYRDASPHATARRIAGVVPPRGRRVSVKRASAAGSCAEPDCDLTYGGGPVQHSPHVYLLLWGPEWTSSSQAYVDLYYLYDGLGMTSHDTWSTITSQYGDSSGDPGFGGSVFEGAWQDGSVPPDPVTPDDLAAEADVLASQLGISDRADTQIVVASQPGTCFSDGFAGSCGTVSPGGSYCAWHSFSSAGVPFTNLPYQPDAGTVCGKNWVNPGATGTYDGVTTVAGHEYAESITDPEAGQGWYDPADGVSGGEIADKCAWGGLTFGLNDPKGNITLSTGTFAMQSLWSNAAGRCVLTSAPHVTVTSPGTQKSTLGRGVSLQIQASTNTGTALSYKASGLPGRAVHQRLHRKGYRHSRDHRGDVGGDRDGLQLRNLGHGRLQLAGQLGGRARERLRRQVRRRLRRPHRERQQDRPVVLRRAGPPADHLYGQRGTPGGRQVRDRRKRRRAADLRQLGGAYLGPARQRRVRGQVQWPVPHRPGQRDSQRDTASQRRLYGRRRAALVAAVTSAALGKRRNGERHNGGAAEPGEPWHP